MGTIYYGLAGEGHGHAARASVILEHIRQHHRVVVLTFGRSLTALQSKVGSEQLEVRKVPGLYLRYNRWGRMSASQTLASGIWTLRELARHAEALAEELARDASLVISDFEPIVLRAASRVGVPSLSLDHQRFLQACSFEHFPRHLRVKIWSMSGVVDHVYGRPEQMIISGFHLPPLKTAYRHAHRVGALIRANILKAKPESGDHLLVYVRRKCPPHVLGVLERSGLPLRVYGLGRRPDGVQAGPKTTFCEVSGEGFIQDLASCYAVCSTAGNQLIGEAFHLGKPVLAFPEPGNFEQQINARLINDSGGGVATSHRSFDDALLRSFLGRVDGFRSVLGSRESNGNPRAVALVDGLLRDSGLRTEPRVRLGAPSSSLLSGAR